MIKMMQSTYLTPVKIMVLRTQTKPNLKWRRLRKSRIRAGLKAVIRTNRLVEVLAMAAQGICLQWAKVRIRALQIWRRDQKSTCPSYS